PTPVHALDIVFHQLACYHHLPSSTNLDPRVLPLSLHAALPIFAADGDGPLARIQAQDARSIGRYHVDELFQGIAALLDGLGVHQDRKSTRLNSSHGSISYAVFCLNRKSKTRRDDMRSAWVPHAI